MQLGTSRLDDGAVRSGVWTDFVLIGVGSEPVTISLLLALADANVNSQYKEALRTALDPYERMLGLYKKASDMPKSLADKINEVGKSVFTEQIVLGWKGITKNGTDQAYTPEGGMQLFAEFPELLTEAESEAGKFERYRVAILEDASGNSQSA